MLKKLFLLLCIGALISCNKNSETTQIEVLFAPAFLHPTKFTIDTKNKTLEQFTFQQSYYKEERIDSITMGEYRIDTMIVQYRKTFKIGEQDFNAFARELEASQLHTTADHRRDILDGIAFRINKINAKIDTISLTSNSPIRTQEYEMDYQILDAFFDLAYKTVEDYDGISMIENIQDYFQYGLPIRRINDNPIEYRVHGSIYGCRKSNTEFIDFLDSLPENKPILFDVRNGSIAFCLIEVLEEFSEKKGLYIYGNNSMLEAKEIMDAIKLDEKNGEQLSELRISAYETHKMIYENWKNNKKIRSFETREEIINTMANDQNK